MLVVMNHISHIDPPIDAVFVHRNGRVPRFLAKDSLFRMPVFKHMISGAGSIPVYRASASAGDSLVAAKEALRDGKLVVIYPEGTITRDPDGWPMRSRTGVARLALDCLELRRAGGHRRPLGDQGHPQRVTRRSSGRSRARRSRFNVSSTGRPVRVQGPGARQRAAA